VANPIQKPYFFGETIQILFKKTFDHNFFHLWQNFAQKKMHWLE
jgi:hypothetical protein